MKHLYRSIRHALSPCRKWFWDAASSITPVRYFNHYPVRVPAGTGFRPFMNHPYEQEEWETVWKFGRAGGSFLDIGANIGIITVAMSKIAGTQGHVIAFEPHPDAFFHLQQTLRSNRCANALPVQSIVTDTCGATEFFLSRDNLGVRSSTIVKDPDHIRVLLPAVTIDAMVEPDTPLDYIKIDTEGAELRILRGARRTLTRQRPVVQIEVHGPFMAQGGDTVEALFQFMREHRFRIFNAATGQETTEKEFLTCTHCHAVRPFTGTDMAYEGYGQIVCIPEERPELFRSMEPHACRKCTRRSEHR